GVSFPIFYLRCPQALFWPSSGRHFQRAAVRCSACPFALVCAIVRSGKLLRDRIRMERFNSCRDDDAFSLQFAHPYRPRVSGDLFSMTLSESGGLLSAESSTCVAEITPP